MKTYDVSAEDSTFRFPVLRQKIIEITEGKYSLESEGMDRFGYNKKYSIGDKSFDVYLFDCEFNKRICKIEVKSQGKQTEKYWMGHKNEENNYKKNPIICFSHINNNEMPFIRVGTFKDIYKIKEPSAYMKKYVFECKPDSRMYYYNFIDLELKNYKQNTLLKKNMNVIIIKNWIDKL